MSAINPLYPLVGGLMIGTAAAGFLLLNGRIAGISGLTAALTGLSRAGAPRALAAGFLGGMLAAATLALMIIRRPDFTVTTSLPVLIVGGLLVGFGTRLGSGCTSGHGVCGLARLSPRSLAATATFMLAAAATVFVMRHVIGA
jgi:uncharacterized membrane protein YedE/YeeE